MKKLFVVISFLTFSLIASAEYKVFNLVNGTNDVHVEGAILPIAIDVNSTVSNKTVSVSRISYVDLLKKCYDITTNEIRWTETEVSTNDYFTLHNKMLVTNDVADVSLSVNDTFYIFADDENVMTRDICFTNRNLSATPVNMNFHGSTNPHVVHVAKGGNVYVASVSSSGLWYSTNITDWTKCNMPEEDKNENFFHTPFYGGGLFIATMGSGVECSSDGITWEYLDTGDWIGSGIYADGKYLLKGKYDRGLFVGNHPTSMTRVVESTISVTALCYGNGLFCFSSGEGQFWSSTNGVVWAQSTIPSLNKRTSEIFFDQTRKCFYIRLYTDYIKDKCFSYATTDFVTFTPLSTLFESDTMCSTASGEIYALAYVQNTSNLSPVKLTEVGNQHYSHVSGCIGTSELWSAGEGYKVEYNPLSYGYGKYWKQTSGSNVSYVNNSDQRPSSLIFPFPCEGCTSDASLTITRTTNYIHRIRYEYVTNRVYNVIERSVSTTKQIVNAQCVDGVNSQEITNKVYLIGNDRILVDGVIQNETESTKATLIVQ